MAKFCFRSKRTGGREAWIDDRWLIKCLNFGVLFLFFLGKEREIDKNFDLTIDDSFR